jgi:hypothetical protein
VSSCTDSEIEIATGRRCGGVIALRGGNMRAEPVCETGTPATEPLSRALRESFTAPSGNAHRCCDRSDIWSAGVRDRTCRAASNGRVFPSGDHPRRCRIGGPDVRTVGRRSRASDCGMLPKGFTL